MEELEQLTPDTIEELFLEIGNIIHNNQTGRYFGNEIKWNSYQFYIGKDKKYCISLLMDMERNKNNDGDIIVVRGISITEKGYGVYG